MGKIIVFVLGLAVLLGVAYHYTEGSAKQAAAQAAAANAEPSAPKRQLDNVRQATHRIEVQGQQQADKAGQEVHE